jgi:hypothetical protein
VVGEPELSGAACRESSMPRQKRRKDKAPLLNYDPARYDAPVQRLEHVRFVNSDGTDDFTLLVPANELEGKSEDERNSVLLDRFRIFLFVRTLEIEKSNKDERLLADMVSRFTWLTARAIAINSMVIYVERAKTEEVIDRRKEPDPDTLAQIAQNLTERIYHNLNKSISNNRDTVNALDQQLFSNIFASAILKVHRRGSSVFGTHPDDVKEAVLRHLKERKLVPYERTIESMAEVYACQLLDRIGPVSMPIEKLRSFILAKVDTGIILPLSELTKYLVNLQRRQGKEIICRIDGEGADIQISIKVPSPVDPLRLAEGPSRERSYTKDHFRELALAAVEAMAKENKTGTLTKKGLCEKLGISDTTLNNYLKDDPELWRLLQKSYLEARLKRFRETKP